MHVLFFVVCFGCFSGGNLGFRGRGVGKSTKKLELTLLTDSIDNSSVGSCMLWMILIFEIRVR